MKRQINEDSDNGREGEEGEHVNFLVHSADVGNWVMVVYEKKPYLGQVTNISASDGYQVKTVESPQGTNWFVWSEEEEIWYEQVLHVASPPNLANRGGAFKFYDCDYQK